MSKDKGPKTISRKEYIKATGVSGDELIDDIDMAHDVALAGYDDRERAYNAKQLGGFIIAHMSGVEEFYPAFFRERVLDYGIGRISKSNKYGHHYIEVDSRSPLKRLSAEDMLKILNQYEYDYTVDTADGAERQIIRIRSQRIPHGLSDEQKSEIIADQDMRLAAAAGSYNTSMAGMVGSYVAEREDKGHVNRIGFPSTIDEVDDAINGLSRAQRFYLGRANKHEVKKHEELKAARHAQNEIEQRINKKFS